MTSDAIKAAIEHLSEEERRKLANLTLRPGADQFKAPGRYGQA